MSPSAGYYSSVRRRRDLLGSARLVVARFVARVARYFETLLTRGFHSVDVRYRHVLGSSCEASGLTTESGLDWLLGRNFVRETVKRAQWL